MVRYRIAEERTSHPPSLHPSIIGIIILMVVGRDKTHRGTLLVGYYLTSFYPGISPLISSWSSQNTGGNTKRKVTTGLLFVGASARDIIGPYLFTPAEASSYSRALRSNPASFVTIGVLGLLGMAWIKALNRKHAATRASMGKVVDVVDLIMQITSKIKTEEAANAEVGGLGKKALDDETDLKDEDFIYVLLNRSKSYIGEVGSLIIHAWLADSASDSL